MDGIGEFSLIQLHIAADHGENEFLGQFFPFQDLCHEENRLGSFGIWQTQEV